ncbi:MAG: DUF4440 domain-containing protein [Silvibacterium sp.]|nr:DUF4440 domain-containing protein [Silvibacterium sp.]MBV8437142.1 DUF4440 domain-containing protein [Silvibacterium sp.]
MRKFPISICVLLLSLSLTACKENAPDTAADEKAIRDNEAAWNNDWKAKDPDKIVSHYSPDAVLLIANMPAMKGGDAIKSGIGPMLKDPHLSLTFAPTVVVIAKGDDMAYTQGIYTMTYTEPKTGLTLIEKGKYVTVYKKQDDGTWKAVEDIDNADSPATPAPASETPATKS